MRRLSDVKRRLLVGLGVVALFVGGSWLRAMLQPNSPGWRLRSAEWVRDHHGGWALDICEWGWYSLRSSRLAQMESAKLSAFPAPFEQRARGKHRPSAAEPAPIPPLFDKPLRQEGVWQGVGRTIGGAPALRCTMFRPDTDHPRVVVGVARFTAGLTRFVLVPGTQDPGGTWSWGGQIPNEERPALLAAFNAGFRLNEAQGGFYVEGKLAVPLVSQAASLVIDADGNVDIEAWGKAKRLGPGIVAIRQNLRLVVDGGAPVAGLERNVGGAWGFGRNQAYYTWRSAIGITSDGALLYLAGDGLTLMSLANALAHAGALRAMELDIHEHWSSFNVYQPKPGQESELVATKLLPGMPWPARRYLTPDDRDFVAAFVR